jgi:putative drug exporter of the RND superfamily
MRKLAAWCHDRRRTVLALWVGAFLLAAVLWGAAAGDYINNFRLPGTESQRAYDLLKDRFPQQAGDTASVVFAVDDGNVLAASHRPQIEKAIGEIKSSPAVLSVSDPFAKGAPVSKDGRITFAQIQFRQGAGDVDVKQVKTMADDTLKLDGQGGVQVALGGDIIHWSTAEQGGAGEIAGIIVAAFVLFLTLGVVAMGLPLLNALFAMIVSLSIMAVIGTRVLDVVDWTPQLAAMLGIGVGIDYALLILNRFRLERGDAHLDRHVGPRRPVRRHRRRDRDARDAAPRHLVPLRTGDRCGARGAGHDAGVAHPDAGRAEQDRRAGQAGEERRRGR